MATQHRQWVCVQVTHQVDPVDCSIFVVKESAEGKQMNVQSDARIRTDRIATIPADWIVKPIGTCPLMKQIDQNLRMVLAL
ncbi:MAG: hypothetical protein KGI98_03130 [Euryarchaeota archaeon]|nr:hypothetical protein [Euryarchaeota archaeon]